MRTRRLFMPTCVFVLATALVVAAGCGSSGDGAQPAAAPGASAAGTAGAAAATTTATTGTATSGEDAAIAPIRRHPKLAQPEAGVSGTAEDELAAAPPPTSLPVSDAEVRREVAKMERIYNAFPDPTVFDRSLLSGTQLELYSGFKTAIASVFFDYNKPIACGGVLHRTQLGVANKTLPCGTPIIFRYHGRAIRVPVIDRGPYIKGRTWDLTGATAVALRFNGLDRISWTYG